MKPSLTKITRGLTGARWQVINFDPGPQTARAASTMPQTAQAVSTLPDLLDFLHAETGENRILLRCLLNRGLSNAEEVQKFLRPEFVNHLHSPYLLRDMERATERLRRALRDRER